MRFVVKGGVDPTARADATLLLAMGLPGGGIVSLGDTHVVVAPGEVPSPNALLVGPRTLANADVAVGESIDVRRAILPRARRVVLGGAQETLDGRHLVRALQGRPVTVGDTLFVKGAYGEDDDTEVGLVVTDVSPEPAAVVGPGTVIHDAQAISQSVVAHERRPPGEAPTTADALLAGLDTEREVLTGWFTLLTSPDRLPDTWGLPAVAGVIIEGPAGCGKSELVDAAAAAVGASVREVPLDMVFKPDRLLTLLERAVKETPAPAIVFLDHVDAVAGTEGMFETQAGAVFRWFLDAVADRPGIACALGVSSVARLTAAITASPLLPRRLTIPPPDTRRRRLLFEAALAQVPRAELDFERLAARTAGFSGADVIAAVLEATAVVARTGEPVTQEIIERAIEGIPPSLGSTSLGEVPSYGFDRVADLETVKQRLTETVIWQMTDPDRFRRLGIEPPRGLLLWGPPGTGKTFVVRALAHESGAAFFPVKGAELLDKWVGESERAVREVFARARAVAPSILFFDEIDALAPVRGHSTNTVTDSVVAALLTEMDGVADRGDVFVIGATNRKDLVDPAVVRPGRLEVHLHLGLPSREARAAFFSIADVPFAPDVDLDAVVAATEGRSFADLAALLREAALHALRRDPSALAVTAADMTAALAAGEG